LFLFVLTQFALVLIHTAALARCRVS